MEKQLEIVDSVLNFGPISRIRRNHGLEHATLHILAERHPRTSMAGHSDMGGFWILGDVTTEEVQSAVDEALNRLQSGERNLAVHANCGTNFVTAGIFAGVAAWMAMFSAGRSFRDKLERLPLAATMATLALIMSQPVGLFVQEHYTTSPIPESLEVVEVIPITNGRVRSHRVVTRG